MRRTVSAPVLLVALAALAPVVLGPSNARAQTSASETAKVTQLFKSGKAAFAKGDLAEAERLFAEAFALRKSSDIAANLGQSELEQQKFRAAAEHFQWALANLLPSASDAQRKAVETGLAKSRAEVGLLRLDISPEGSSVLVGEQDVGKAPIAGGVYVDPGEVIVSVKHEGYVSIDKRVMVGKGTEQAVEVTLVAKETPSAPIAGPVDSGLQPSSGTTPSADTSTSPKSLVPAYVATGVAVAGGVTGLVFLLSANSKASKADDLRDDLVRQGGCGTGADPSGCNDLLDKRKSVDTMRSVEIGAFVVGGVAAVVAGYFYWDALSHRSGAQQRASAQLVPTLNVSTARPVDGGGLQSVKIGVSGTF